MGAIRGQAWRILTNRTGFGYSSLRTNACHGASGCLSRRALSPALPNIKGMVAALPHLPLAAGMFDVVSIRP